MEKIQFGAFEIHPRSGQLLRDGEPVRIAPQPFRVLALLVQHRGELVTREELQAAVWQDGTNVEFDLGLNYCIHQIRLALKDEDQQTSYVVTVPKRGYRLGVPVTEVTHPTPPATIAEMPVPSRKRALRYAAVAALFAVGSWGLWLLGHAPPADPLDPESRRSFQSAQVDAQSWDGGKVGEAIAVFRGIAAKYPAYAPAQAELANALVIRGFQGELPAVALAEAEKTARAALRIDPNLPLAHAALGHCYWQKWMWIEGGQELDRAVALGPDLAVPHQLYALYLSSKGRHTDAIAEARRAASIEPNNPLVNFTLARVYFIAGDDARTIEAIHRVREIAPDYRLAFGVLALAHINRHEFDDAERVLAESGRANPDLQIILLARSGRMAEAKELVESRRKATAGRVDQPPAPSAAALIAVGEVDQAFANMQRAVELHRQGMIWFAVNPEWEGHREDPRFKSILLQLGLPSAISHDVASR